MSVHWFSKLRLFALLTLLSITPFNTKAAASSDNDCSVQTEIPQSECEALNLFFAGINSLNLFQIENPCSSTGIICDNGHVEEVILPWHGLNGTIADISALTELRALDLWNNSLTGSIPTLSSLTNLETINLSVNQLSGSIPNLSTLTSLKVLNLSNNQLHGSIPELSNLQSLENLSLSFNDLDGSIPALSSLSKLESVSLEENNLTGSIPDISSLDHLKWFLVWSNKLSGPIPTLPANLSNLDVAYNRLSDIVPPSVCQLNSFNLNFNKLNTNSPGACTDSIFGDWRKTQTVPPTNITISVISPNEVQLTWDAIAYTQHGGFYEIWGKGSTSTEYVLMGITTDKTITNAVVSGLQTDETYHFLIRTFTPAHEAQKSDLTSVDSYAITVTLKTIYLPMIAAFSG